MKREINVVLIIMMFLSCSSNSEKENNNFEADQKTYDKKCISDDFLLFDSLANKVQLKKSNERYLDEYLNGKRYLRYTNFDGLFDELIVLDSITGDTLSGLLTVIVGYNGDYEQKYAYNQFEKGGDGEVHYSSPILIWSDEVIKLKEEQIKRVLDIKPHHYTYTVGFSESYDTTDEMVSFRNTKPEFNYVNEFGIIQVVSCGANEYDSITMDFHIPPYLFSSDWGVNEAGSSIEK